MTASGFPTLAGVLIPSAGGGSQIVIVGKRNFVRFSYRAEGPVKSMNLASEPVKSVVDTNVHAFEPRRAAFGRDLDPPFGTEAGQFLEKGIDAVVFGPGSVEQAHKVAEYVEVALDEIEKDVAVASRMLG